MDKYSVRCVSAGRYVVMSYMEDKGQYTDIATVEKEYWAHRIAEALIFEDSSEKKN